MKKRKSGAAPAPEAPRPSHAEIAALAHAFWEAEGRPEGAEWRHWLQAEAELSALPGPNPEPNQ